MKKCLLAVLLIIGIFINSQAAVLIGYWHNWGGNPPYIQLVQIDSRYTVVCVAFAMPTSPSDMTMTFVPEFVSQATFINQIQTLHNQNKKVLLSIGGATGSINLANITNRDKFINSIGAILNTYNFDGIDIDIENGDGILASGTIENPTSIGCLNLIYAINQIKVNYYNANNRVMMLTFAPETAYVQGGMIAYGSIWGGYLPLINHFRNDLNYIHVQLYNSGTMRGLDNNIYSQATADFILAMSEALILGFNTAGGQFQGIPQNKVVIGLPACPNAAGGGFTTTSVVALAVRYLRGVGPKPGSYTLIQVGGYPNIGGMMDWSINWDAVTTCNLTSYEYAQNYQLLFGNPSFINNEEIKINYKLEQNYPNPFNPTTTIMFDAPRVGDVKIVVYDAMGREVQTLVNERMQPGTYETKFDGSMQNSGVYFYKLSAGDFTETKRMLMIK